MSSFRCDRPGGSDPNSAATIRRTGLAMASLACCLIVASAQAQQPPQQQPQGGGITPPAEVAPPTADAPPPSFRPGFLDALGRWFGDPKATIDSQVRSTQETLGALGGQARDAAGNVVAIPGTRVITGRQLCPPATNGAPDCQQGVDALCRTRGFQSGRTLDVTSAHRCSARSWIAEGAPKGGPCRLETYVTRAVCQ
jgi:hypothetical protein